MQADRNITVTIQTGRGSKEFTFPQQTKVKDAAAAAANEFGYPEGAAYILVRASTGQELDGNRTLVSYGIDDGEVLRLSEDGSGV